MANIIDKALQERVAIVTGASSGIGRAAAMLFARHGAKVVVGARRRSELDALVTEVAGNGGHAIALAGDVKDEAFARALVDEAVRRFGGLDVAFNNAGTHAGAWSRLAHFHVHVSLVIPSAFPG